MLIDHIFRCRTISTAGAEQLQLDHAAIKSVLLELPTMTRSSSSEGNSVPPRYQKFVMREMLKVERLLKVVGAPLKALVVTYLELVTEPSEEHFSRLMDLKGMAKADKEPLIEAFRVERRKKAAATVAPSH